MSAFLQAALPGMLTMLCLATVSGFFSASETALFYLSHDELRSFRVGNRREQMAARLLTDPDRLLTAVLFWNLIVNLLYFAVSFVVSERLARAGLGAAAWAFGIASLFGIILLGEVIPKSMAVAFRRQLASLVSWPLAVVVRVLDPISPTFRRATLLARRTFWPHLPREPYLDTEVLERAVEVSELSDEVIRQERQILRNILDLSEIRVEEVMRPRGTYVSMSAPVHLADLHGRVPPSNYLSVQAGETDDIVGAVPLNDFPAIPEQNLEAAAEEVAHVPWCANLASTLQLLRDRFVSLASVVNEFGETIGIVTYDDIVDTLLMPQPSRAKRLLQREPVLEVTAGRFQVEGITTLRYLCKRLGLDYAPESDGLVTVAGMLHDELEHIPVIGDECAWLGYKVKVIDVSRKGQHLRALIWKEQ